MALTDNLVAYWKLDEASGNAADSTGSGRTGINNGATFGTGKINNGGVFANSASSSFSISGMPTGTGSLSCSFWIKTTKSNVSAVSANWGASATNQGVTDGIDTNGKYHINAYGGAGSALSTTVVTDGIWHHIAWVYNGSNFKVYVDGVLEGTSSSFSSLNITSGNGKIGQPYWVNNYFYVGTTDEIGVWTRALSGAEISQLYNSGAGLQYPFTPSFNPALGRRHLIL